MSGKMENLRLRLITDEEDPKKQRPKNCCLCSAVKVSCVFIIIFFLVFIALRVVDILQVLKKKDKDKVTMRNTIPGSELCKSVSADNMTLVALGYLKGTREDKGSMEAKNQLYYLTNRLLTDQEACAVEAVLRLFQDKSVFIIEVGNFSAVEGPLKKVDYTQFLREQYTNLNLIKSTKDMLFKGSPFQNYIKEMNDFSVFAAKVLLVWQFGGTVVSPNLILLTRRLLDNNEGFCEVDRDLLFCPNQCSAYVYELVKSVLDVLRTRNRTPAEHLVDKSVVDYCGEERARLVGCVGVNRIKPYNICHKPNRHCDFLRVQEWKTKDAHWRSVVQKFCPKIVAKYVPDISHNETATSSAPDVEDIQYY